MKSFKNMTDAERWEKLKNMKDEDIDYSDIPPLTEEELRSEKWHVVYPSEKKKINIALDENILDFFKSQGKGYQVRINAVLAAYVKSQENYHHKEQ